MGSHENRLSLSLPGRRAGQHSATFLCLLFSSLLLCIFSCHATATSSCSKHSSSERNNAISASAAFETGSVAPPSRTRLLAQGQGGRQLRLAGGRRYLGEAGWRRAGALTRHLRAEQPPAKPLSRHLPPAILARATAGHGIVRERRRAWLPRSCSCGGSRGRWPARAELSRKTRSQPHTCAGANETSRTRLASPGCSHQHLLRAWAHRSAAPAWRVLGVLRAARSPRRHLTSLSRTARQHRCR